MKDLQLGDKIKVAGDKFSAVYSFGHREPHAHVEYLSINTGLQKPLLITVDHLVFLVVESKYVPASLVKVGDTMLLANGGHVTVRSIKSAIHTGAFAPFTKDGSIVVDGVVASCFVTLQPGSAELIMMIGGGGFFKIHADFHNLARLVWFVRFTLRSFARTRRTTSRGCQSGFNGH